MAFYDSSAGTAPNTACARRKPRASFVCLRTASNVASASSRKWLLRGRIAVLLGGVSRYVIRFWSGQRGYALHFPGSADRQETPRPWRSGL